jgi:hypothetical protein
MPILYKKNDKGEEEKISANFMIVAGYDRQADIQAINDWRIKQESMSKATTSTAGTLPGNN